MSASFSVLILSESGELRKSLHSYLDTLGYWCIEHVSVDGVKSELYDQPMACVLADIASLQDDPVGFLTAVRDRNRSSQIVFVGKSLSMSKAVDALKAGAIDLLDIPVDEQRLEIAIDVARKAAMLESRFARLSPREEEILLLLVQGLQNKSVAIRLGISPRTVDIHRSKLMNKLAVRTFAELCSVTSQRVAHARMGSAGGHGTLVRELIKKRPDQSFTPVVF